MSGTTTKAIVSEEVEGLEDQDEFFCEKCSNCDGWLPRSPGVVASELGNWRCLHCQPPPSLNLVAQRVGPIHEQEEAMRLEAIAKSEEAGGESDGPVAAAHAGSDEATRAQIDDPHRLARINLELYRTTYGREVRYWNETWYLWKAGQYVEITRDHFEARLTQAIKQEFDRAWEREDQEYEDWKKSEKYNVAKDKGPPTVRKVTSSLVRNVVEATRSMCFVSSRVSMHSWTDGRPADDTYVSVANGMLNVSKRIKGEQSVDAVVTKHDAAWFSTSKLPYEYDVDAACPSWVKFLEDVFNGDEEAILALQMWFGYLLTPDMSLHKVLFIIGPTRSGKGTIISVLRELLGHEAIATPTLSSLGQPFGLASLVGKTAAIIADARMPNKGDESIITERLLNITGGDPVDVQRKHKGDLANFKLSCRFTLFSNLLPRLRDASAVFVNRCIFLAMPNSYLGKEDRDLQGRLLAEMSGILNWAIDGRKKLNAAGKITQPTSGFSLLNELQSILSPVSMFLSDCCEVGSDRKVSTHELFAHWEVWCEENDISHPGDIQSFGRKLKAVLPGLGYGRPRESGKVSRTRQYIGLTLRSEDEIESMRLAQSFAVADRIADQAEDYREHDELMDL